MDRILVFVLPLICHFVIYENSCNLGISFGSAADYNSLLKSTQHYVIKNILGQTPLQIFMKGSISILKDFLFFILLFDNLIFFKSFDSLIIEKYKITVIFKMYAMVCIYLQIFYYKFN